MSEQKENVSLLLDTGNVSLMNKISTSKKSPMPFIIVSSRSGRSVPTAVPFGSNQVGELGNHLAEVNSLQAAEQRRAAEDLLVDKVMNGGLRLQLKVQLVVSN